MTEVRSAVLGRVHSATQHTYLLHTVPAGSTTLVKSVVARNDDTVQHTVAVLASAPDGVTFATLYSVALQPNTSSLLQLWVALQQGDTIMASVGPSCAAWVSGAILNGVIPVAPPSLMTQAELLPARGGPSAPVPSGRRPSSGRSRA